MFHNGKKHLIHQQAKIFKLPKNENERQETEGPLGRLKFLRGKIAHAIEEWEEAT